MKSECNFSKGQSGGLKRAFTLIALLGGVAVSEVKADSYTSTTATSAFSSNRWNNTADAAPYTSAFTANNPVSFTSGTYSFAGAISSGTVNVGNVTLSNNVTAQFTTATGTYGTGGVVRTLNVGAGAIFDLAGQNVSTAGTTGFIKSGDGIFKTAGSVYTGGFTLNAGIVILGGTQALGGGALTINGGTIAADATRNITARYTSVSIGGDFTFGAVTAGVTSGNGSATANITFADNMSLGASTRAITIGGNATYTLGGILSGASGTGLTVNAASGATGNLTLGAANTYSGTTSVNGGTLLISLTGSINNSNLVQVTAGALTLQNVTALSDSGTLSLSNGTTLNLNPTGTETINGLVINGTPLAAGTYTSTSLTAAELLFGGTVTFNGGGSLQVLSTVPEPATVFGGFLLVGALGWNQRRRLSGLAGVLRNARAA